MSVDSLTEPEPEPLLSRLGGSIKTGTIGCLGCMAEFFSNLWNCMCDTYFSAVDWTYDNLCCYCTRTSDNEIDQKAVRGKNVQRMSFDAKALKTQPSLQQVVNMSKSSTQKTSNPQASQSTINPSPPSPSSPQQNLLIKRPTSPQQQQQQQPPPPQQQQQQSISTTPQVLIPGSQPAEPTEVSSLEPPKIDFVETGSIFGDRKRVGFDQNMLLLENGRFRSPGLSKVVHGPGGRTIRVSFVTGFPSVKSIESNRSLASAAVKSINRKSYDSGANDMKLKRYKSTKSFKSVSSAELKEETGTSSVSTK